MMMRLNVEARYTAALEHLLRVVALTAYEAETVEDTLRLSLQEICEYTDWPVGHVLMRSEEQRAEWGSAGIWHIKDQERLEPFVSATSEMSFDPESGLFARAVEEGRPLWIASLDDEDDFRREETARVAGLASSLVIPINIEGSVDVLLEFFGFESIDPDDGLLSVLSQIGLQLGVVLKEKQTEQALRASQERFKALVTNSHILIAVLNREGQIQYLSPSVENLLGYAPEAFLRYGGESMLDIVHPEDLDRIEAELERIWGNPGETIELRLRVRHQDKTWRWLESTVTNYLAHPHVQGIVVNSRDITDRVEADLRLQEAARELETSNEELERFAYVASHDLQEPLRMVASYVELLQTRYAHQLDADAREFIEYASDGAERMSRLINDLLAFSRLGTRGDEFQPTDLNVPLQQALRNLENAIQESAAVIRRQELPTVRGDEGQLMQVFQNLISNAIKFREDGIEPEIDIRHRKQGNWWRIEIEDNGIGIDPGVLDRLFVIFTRLHQRDEYGGTGIGLAMSKKIVERHRGAIGVESTPNEGSTFWFTLPVNENSDSEVNAPTKQAIGQEVET